MSCIWKVLSMKCPILILDILDLFDQPADTFCFKINLIYSIYLILLIFLYRGLVHHHHRILNLLDPLRSTECTWVLNFVDLLQLPNFLNLFDLFNRLYLFTLRNKLSLRDISRWVKCNLAFYNMLRSADNEGLLASWTEVDLSWTKIFNIFYQ